MTKSTVTVGTRMEAIANLTKEDLLSLSDEEILAEVLAEGIDPAQEADRLRSSALDKIRLAKRERLVQARSSYDRATSAPTTAKQRPPLEEIKKLVQLVIQGGAASGLQLAFRKGKKLSNSDWEGLWDDMIEMGLIDDGEPEE